MTLPPVFTGSLPGRSPAPERRPDDGESRGRELDPAGRPGTGRGPLSGQADDGKRPDDGKRTDPGKRPDFGRGPDTGSRPDTGRGPDTGSRPDTGRGPDTGSRPDTGRGPDTGSRPDTGRGPDTSREASDRSGPPEPAGSLGPAGAAVLMLADARFPAGGHAHSGSLEGAVTGGAVTDVGSLDLFLRGRLTTTGVVAGALAAAACAAAWTVVTSRPPEEVTGGVEIEGGPVPASPVPASPVPASQPALSARAAWAARLDAEADARTPSPAQREASRRQGRALLRAARAAWPGPWLADLAAAPQPPHHAVVLGATAAAAGCSPGEAALIAAYLTVTGPASAAVRLLALDPIEVSAMIARLAGAIETAAARGAAAETDDLPYPSAPALDLYAEAHARAEVRLFAS